MLFRKIREKRKLIAFRKILSNSYNKFPEGYLESHQSRIECLDWLIGYYEGRTASNPKELLESMLKVCCRHNTYSSYVEEMKSSTPTIIPMTEAEQLKRWIHWIDFLYEWVNYKKISGF